MTARKAYMDKKKDRPDYLPELDSIQQRLTFYMAEKKLTQTKLAQKTGYNRKTIYRLVTGQTTNPTLEVLSKISDALGLTVSEFLSPIPKFKMVSRAFLMDLARVCQFYDVKIHHHGTYPCFYHGPSSLGGMHELKKRLDELSEE